MLRQSMSDTLLDRLELTDESVNTTKLLESLDSTSYEETTLTLDVWKHVRTGQPDAERVMYRRCGVSLSMTPNQPIPQQQPFRR